MTMNEPGTVDTAPREAAHPAVASGGPMFVCPYCGSATPDQPRCAACRGFLDPLSRQASQNAMGPWFLRNPDSPHQSGCSYETLVMLISRGRVTVDSVLRGPTTHQFWTPAKRVPGVASLLGLCHNCGSDVDGDEHECPECHAEFTHHPDRQDLGLMPVRAVPGQPVPLAAESARGPAAREPQPSLAEPPASLLRHVEALESQNRWVWKLAVTMLALVSITAALAAAGFLSGFLRVDPAMGAGPRAESGEAQAPAPSTPELPGGPSRGPSAPVAEPGGAPAPPMGASPAVPGSSPARAEGVDPDASGAAEPSGVKPKVEPGAPAAADGELAELRRLVAQDTDDSLNTAVSRLKALGAGDGKRPELDALLRAAEVRQSQRALRGVR